MVYLVCLLMGTDAFFVQKILYLRKENTHL